jgi:DNA-binding IclR family transcriptional regulator
MGQSLWPLENRSFVTSLARGLAILEAFREGEGKFGNQAIARRTGLPKPTVSRLTHTLVELGYLAYCRRERKYALSSSTLALGFAVQPCNRIRHRLRPHLEGLVGRFGGVAVLAESSRLSMICVDACAATPAPAVWMEPGSRLPLFEEALGRLFAAALPPKRRLAVLAQIRREEPEVAAAVERLRISSARQGFHASQEGMPAGWTAVMAAVAGADETASGVLACFVPSAAVAHERAMLAVGFACARTAQEIATEMVKATVGAVR